MKLYARLVQVFFRENFSLKRLFGLNTDARNRKTLLLGAILIFSFGMFLYSFGILFMDLGKTLFPLGYINMLLMYVFVYSSMLTIMFSLLRSNGYLFQYKDFQILAPLPIPDRIVLFAKVTVMMIMTYFTTLLFAIPIVFCYFYYAGFQVISFLIFIIGFLAIPLIPTIVCSFLALIISHFTSKLKSSKIFTIILLFVVFLGIMVLSFSMSMNTENPFLNQQGFIKGLGDIYIPMMWFVESVDSNNLLSLLKFVLISTVPFVLYLLAIQKIVTKTNQAGLSIKTRTNTKKAVSISKPVLYSLIQKEFKKFINVPIYALNVGFGPVMLFLAGIASLFFHSQIESALQMTAGLEIPFEFIILIVMGFMLSMLYSPAISLSLEGKNFWIIKSIPVPASKIMTSKIIFNLILGIPVALFSLVFFSISFGFSLIGFFVMCLFIISFSFVTSVFDAIINLYFPKFNYMNETEVVKQSLAAFLSMLGNMAILVIDGFVGYFAYRISSWEVSLLLIALTNGLLTAIFYSVITSQSAKLFHKMQA